MARCSIGTAKTVRGVTGILAAARNAGKPANQGVAAKTGAL